MTGKSAKFERICAVVSILIAISMLVSVVPGTFADTSGGEASVGNSTPSVVDVSISTGSVSPESYFTVNTRVRDNNSLSDLDNVTVTLLENTSAVSDPDSKENHYTFWFDPSDNTWHSSPSSNVLGSSFIDGSGSSYPSDESVVEDNYNFRVLLNGTASPANDWDVEVEVVDSASANGTLHMDNPVTVNTHLSYSVVESLVHFSGSAPSSDNPASENPVDIENIETNVNFDVQNELVNPAWENASTGDNIPAENTGFNSVNDSSTRTNMSTAFQDVYANVEYGEDLSENVYYWLDIPLGTDPLTYTNTFRIQVSEH